MIIWDGVVTFLILKGIGLFTSLRMTDKELAIGDLEVHGEVAYPEEEPEAVPVMVGDATDHKGPGDPISDGAKVLAD